MSLTMNNCVVLFLIHSIWEQVTNIGAHLRWIHFHNLRQAFTFDMPPKRATVLGAALQPLDTNQDALSLWEARSQKRKATSPTLQEEQLDQEIRDLEAIHQQVQKRRKCFGWLIFRRRLTTHLRRSVILLRKTRTEGLSTGSFVRRAHSTKTNGTTTFIKVTLLLMMLLP
jgi:hypothetical protein